MYSTIWILNVTGPRDVQICVKTEPGEIHKSALSRDEQSRPVMNGCEAVKIALATAQHSLTLPVLLLTLVHPTTAQQSSQPHALIYWSSLRHSLCMSGSTPKCTVVVATQPYPLLPAAPSCGSRAQPSPSPRVLINATGSNCEIKSSVPSSPSPSLSPRQECTVGRSVMVMASVCVRIPGYFWVTRPVVSARMTARLSRRLISFHICCLLPKGLPPQGAWQWLAALSGCRSATANTVAR